MILFEAGRRRWATNINLSAGFTIPADESPRMALYLHCFSLNGEIDKGSFVVFLK